MQKLMNFENEWSDKAFDCVPREVIRFALK